MSQADELLRNLTDEQIALYSGAGSGVEEPHIVIGRDRYIVIPESLKKIAVEHDHNIETVTFDCPRHWDEHDLSKLILYINYRLPNGEIGSYIAKNIKVVDDDNFTFTWTIRREVTKYKGNISFLVCAKSTEMEGDEALEKLHWNTELCTDAYVSEGLESEAPLEEEYPDIVTQLLERMTEVENIAVKKVEMDALVEQATQASQQAFNSATDTKNSAAEIRNSYANAIKGKASGEIVRVDDVSPLEHDVEVKVRGKNLANPNNILRALSVDLSYTEPELHIRKTNDTEKWSNIYVGLGVYKDFVGKTLTMSLDNMGDYTWSVLIVGTNNKGELLKEVGGASAKNGHTKFTVTVPKMIDAELLAIRIVSGDNLVTTGEEYILKNIQVEEGSAETEYEPYIDPLSVTLYRFGKNLINQDLMSSSATLNGVTITRTGSQLKLNGTLTVDSVLWNTYFCFHAGVGNKYTLSYEYLGGTVSGTSNICVGDSETKDSARQSWVNIAMRQSDISYTNTLPKPFIKDLWFYAKAGTVFTDYRIQIQLESGSNVTKHESATYITATPESPTSCSILSAYPITNIFTDTPGVTIDVTYNRDTSKMVGDIGNIETALDSIIAIQNQLIGGDA